MAAAMTNKDNKEKGATPSGNAVNDSLFSDDKSKEDSDESANTASMLKQILKKQNVTNHELMSLRKRVVSLENYDNPEYDEFDECENYYVDHDNEDENYDLNLNKNDEENLLSDLIKDGQNNQTTDEYSHGEGKRKSEGERFSAFAKKFKVSENVCGPVTSDLAKLADDLFTGGLETDRFNEIKDNLKRPENCKFLQTVKCDLGIWQNISPFSRARDLAFQVCQTAIAKAACGMVTLLDKVDNSLDGSHKELKEELIESGSQILASVGHANYTLCMRRRDLLKPSLALDYRHICSTNIPLTENLFGGELEKSIDNITKTNKVGTKVNFKRGTSYPYRGRGQNTYNNNYSHGNNGRGAYNYRGSGRGNNAQNFSRGFGQRGSKNSQGRGHRSWLK